VIFGHFFAAKVQLVAHFSSAAVDNCTLAVERCVHSAVAAGFLDELDARSQAEFGVDVGEVGLHGAR
jgi:hypothetical protein